MIPNMIFLEKSEIKSWYRLECGKLTNLKYQNKDI